MADLFRERALEKLRSPERLDQLLRVTTPVGWLALMAWCLVLAGTMTWGFYGRVTTKVSGTGIIIDPRGLFDVEATGQGEIVGIKVHVGDEVAKGQVVVHLIDPTMAKRIQNQESKLRQLESDFKKSSELLEKETVAKRLSLKKQRLDLKQQIHVLKTRIEWLDKRIVTLTGLFEKGLVTEKVLADRRLERDNTLLKVARTRQSMSDVIAQEADLEAKKFESLSEKRLQIADSKRNVARLKETQKQVTRVRSLVAGMVVAIQADEGQVVQEGQAIISVEPQGRIPMLDLYVRAFEGKQIQLGMKVQFTPSTVKREEYGFMLGKVKEVSPFPAASAAIMKSLQNEDLVKSLLRRGPVLRVKGEFERDSRTTSGFKWSSHKGAGVRISTGTLGIGEVVVKEQPPVTLVLPAIKRWMGVE